MKQMPYTDIVPQLQTGDLILFSGRYSLSKMVQKLEGSPWSHVGMVVRLPGIKEPLLWESTVLINLPDVIELDYIPGPKLVHLLDRLQTYGQDVTPYEPPVYAWRPLVVERTEEMQNSLRVLISKLHGIPNLGKWETLFDVLKGRFFRIRSKPGNYTCSELIGETYVKMGLLNPKTILNAFMPSDFSSDAHLKLLRGEFEELIEIQLP